jgi:RNA-directed DNA polymerase
MLKKNKKRLLWKKLALFKFATNWVNKLRRKKGAVSEYSPWWVFVYDWRILIEFWLNDFLAGNYRFSPMITHHISGETSITWSYKDRLIVKWIHKIITPVFKHIVSPLCFHLSGASGVKKAVKRIKTVLESKHFRYFIRADIKSYYASIDRNILVTQIQQYFNDPRLLKYLTDIIHIPIVDEGVVFTHETGLPRRSSLSPFFGAIYLSPLDQIFERSKGIFYIRYMD